MRIVASLAMKETTHATIIKKLSSSKRIHPTLKALIELDKMIMSLYMLDYIDDVGLRQNVHRSLNRGEAFHQLRSALLRISGRKLDGKTDLEFQISNECNRFLSICIIYYNAAILSEILKICHKQNYEEMCEMMKRFSPVAWAHINCVGKFEFLKNHQTIDLQATAVFIIQNHALGIFNKTQ